MGNEILPTRILAPVGGVQIISDAGGYNQSIAHDITALAGGGFAVSWRETSSSSSRLVVSSATSDAEADAYVQLYNSDGQAISDPLSVETDGIVHAQANYVFADDNGGVRVLFQNGVRVEYILDGIASTGIRSEGLYLTAIDAEGNIGARHEQIDSPNGYIRTGVLLEGGEIAALMHSGELHIFDLEGETTTTQIPLPDHHIEFMDIAALSDGGVVLRYSALQDGNTTMYAYTQRFNADGTTRDATPVEVLSWPARNAAGVYYGDANFSQTAADVYQVTFELERVETGLRDLWGQRFGADGVLIDAEPQLVETDRTEQRFSPRIADLGDDGVAIIWTIANPPGGEGDALALQNYGPDGEVVGSTVIVPQHRDAFVYNSISESARITALEDGSVIVSWEREQSYSDHGVSTNYYSEHYFHRYNSFYQFEGSPDQDVLSGTSQDDLMNGLGGADDLRGGAGTDYINGGLGADTLIGGAGNDTLIGGISDADLRDVIYGGGGNDLIDGGYGNDELRGDAGNDNIAGGFGADTVIGGTGNDTITGSTFGDVMFGGEGDDFVNGGFGSDRVNGGAGADKFYHLGIRDHGSDWIQDFNGAEDVLFFGENTATRDQFQINVTTTPTAGEDDVQEAFIIYRPTGQIMWALVDGAGQADINLRIGTQTFDLTEPV